ncbi:MAG TPA: tetratricopeptide repeat protein [Isosphaeraceae bacterium]|jgi:Flp pilus assembly protein TadD|nr:tetratricopeptide repeat protein [Isosphaeraceae bacterium]
MAQIVSDRIKRWLSEAEGYLMLGLPARALEILQGRDDWATMQFEASFLTGEALRALGRHRDALDPLEAAAKLRPDDIGVAIALGWCYKRTHRLAQAIDALDRARCHHPAEPLIHYNLACYWSLAGDPRRALDALTLSLNLQPSLRERIGDEPDFDALRTHPEFARLASPRPLQA